MHVLVEAKTRRGVRRFLVSGNSEAEGVAWLHALVDRRARILDEFGEQIEAFSIDPSSIEAQSGPGRRGAAASRFGTNGQRVE